MFISIQFRGGILMQVKVHLYTQSEPVIRDNVRNTYQKGDLYCVMMSDGKTVYKFPLQHI
ncbi:MAG: hypothetical protein Greene101415_1089, partial [Parcubacteria group bacterium Greene1014_15]